MIVKQIVIHHSASNRDLTTLNDINNWHRIRFNFISSLGYYVAYHYVILSNGEVKQTRRDNEIGAHSVPNEGKIGICLTGNFQIEFASNNQLNSLDVILEKLKKEYNLQDKDIFAHRELSKTECPGNNLMQWINLKRHLSLLQKLLKLLKELLKLKT